MKIWILVFSLAVFAGGTCLGVALHPTLAPKGKVRSEGGWAWGRHGELSVQRFADALDLTEEQDRELDFILEENQRDLAALGRAMRDAHERARERIVKILTPEQQKKLDDLRAAERRERDARDVERTIKAWTASLPLRPEQVEPVRKVLLEGKERRRAHFADRKADSDPSKVQDFFRALRAEQAKALESILTPEQHKRYLDSQEWER